ncbi:hypothetical protein SAMN04488563_5953 [Jiangella alkaliphila]|uniref:Uncharacterized protein n=1 Tax=Jiangella alkaliphila TaxID=419479 RepID=A0A1H2LDY5_9ACTN|nr:hypothetical protein SAMN04488563_5953 [Jiangella alkaliphila]
MNVTVAVQGYEDLTDNGTRIRAGRVLINHLCCQHPTGLTSIPTSNLASAI